MQYFGVIYAFSTNVCLRKMFLNQLWTYSQASSGRDQSPMELTAYGLETIIRKARGPGKNS